MLLQKMYDVICMKWVEFAYEDHADEIEKRRSGGEIVNVYEILYEENKHKLLALEQSAGREHFRKVWKAWRKAGQPYWNRYMEELETEKKR